MTAVLPQADPQRQSVALQALHIASRPWNAHYAQCFARQQGVDSPSDDFLAWLAGFQVGACCDVLLSHEEVERRGFPIWGNWHEECDRQPIIYVRLLPLKNELLVALPLFLERRNLSSMRASNERGAFLAPGWCICTTPLWCLMIGGPPSMEWGRNRQVFQQS